MSVSYAAYKVALDELSSSSKFDNAVQAIEDSMNAIGDTSKMGWKTGLIFDPSQIKQNAAAAGQALVWNGAAWAPASVSGPTSYKKITEKDVANTVVKTDLFNAEITVGAGVMTSSGRMVFEAFGDYLNNSGAGKTVRLELKLGAQVLWDATSESITNNASRSAWRLSGIIQANSATNAQRGGGTMVIGGTSGTVTTGTGYLGGSSGGGNFGTFGPFMTVATTVDMTASQTFTFSVTHSAAAATISMRCEGARVEVFG